MADKTAAEKPKKKKPARSIAIGDTAMMTGSTTDLVDLADGFKSGVNGLEVDGSPPIANWGKALRSAKVFERGSPFTIGDAVNYGEDRYGEEASQYLDASEGWSEKTLSVYRWISKRILKSDRRMDRLGIAHHLAVAALTPAKQRLWLGKAAADGEESPWTVARLKKALKDGEEDIVEDFFVLVRCGTERKRDKLMAELEGQGWNCKATEKRTPKKKQKAEAKEDE